MPSAAKRDETVFFVLNRRSNDTTYHELFRDVLKSTAAGVAYDQLRANHFGQELDVVPLHLSATQEIMQHPGIAAGLSTSDEPTVKASRTYVSEFMKQRSKHFCRGVAGSWPESTQDRADAEGLDITNMIEEWKVRNGPNAVVNTTAPEAKKVATNTDIRSMNTSIAAGLAQKHSTREHTPPSESKVVALKDKVANDLRTRESLKIRGFSDMILCVETAASARGEGLEILVKRLLCQGSPVLAGPRHLDFDKLIQYLGDEHNGVGYEQGNLVLYRPSDDEHLISRKTVKGQLSLETTVQRQLDANYNMFRLAVCPQQEWQDLENDDMVIKPGSLHNLTVGKQDYSAIGNQSTPQSSVNITGPIIDLTSPIPPSHASPLSDRFLKLEIPLPPVDRHERVWSLTDFSDIKPIVSELEVQRLSVHKLEHEAHVPDLENLPPQKFEFGRLPTT